MPPTPTPAPTTAVRGGGSGDGRMWIAVPALLLAAVAAWFTFAGTSDPAAGIDPARVSAATGPLPAGVYACARCHVLPPPDLLPRDRWPHLIDYMTVLIEQYELGVPITAAELDQVREYYLGHCPGTDPPLPERYLPSPVRFAALPFGDPGSTAAGMEPLVFGLAVEDLDRDLRPDVLVCDARLGMVTWARYDGGRWRETPIVGATAPARTAVADLNADGNLDVAIAVLGSVTPTEDACGQVLLVLTDADNRWSLHKVLEDVPRVCDVRVADVDGDGDPDLLVAMFGLYKTGGIAWLEHRSDGAWERHQVYERTGCSHVVPIDLDGDGHLDLVAMASQEHEEIVALHNRGGGEFEAEVVFRAPSPMFGLSGLSDVDLDGDGDHDLLFTNGDALDIDPVPKPWHGVQWLENKGGGSFELREIWRFPGAYAAVAADLDDDGDRDVVVTSMMNRWDEQGRQSIAWLENDGAQGFTPHAIDDTPTALVCVATGDLDQDGRVDVLAGGMYVMPPFRRTGRIRMWSNRGR